MNEEHIYKGSKTKNYFSAYLLASVQGRRKRYLEIQKKIQLAEASLIRLEKIDTKVYYSVNKEMLQKCFGFYQKKLLHP